MIAAAQLLAVLPVLYAAWRLRWPAAVGVTLLATIGIGLASAALAPERAMTDIGASAVVLTALTGLLSRARATAAVHQQLPDQDQFPGLANRVTFETALADALQVSERASVSLVLVHLDRVRSDAVVTGVAASVRGLTRPGDLVGRLGRTELAVLLPGCPLVVARDRAERLRASLGSSVSVGIATAAPGDADTVTTVYRAAAADLAVTKAGEVGR